MGEMADDMYDDMLIAQMNFDFEVEANIESGVWLTKDFKEIQIADMTTSHLRNSINYIKRGGDVYGYADQYLPLLEAELLSRI